MGQDVAGPDRIQRRDAAQLPALPANTAGPYLPDAHNHRVSSRADSHALGLNVQFHHPLSAVGEKERITAMSGGSGRCAHTDCEPTAALEDMLL